jgi:UDP-N-acetyl-D-glucosamine dehydrogenase
MRSPAVFWARFHDGINHFLLRCFSVIMRLESEMEESAVRNPVGEAPSEMVQSCGSTLAAKIESRTAKAGIIGLGYVGLPLAMACSRAGFGVVGLDVDPEKVATLRSRKSYIDAVSDDMLDAQIASGQFRATCEYALLAEVDVIIICVPTPLSRNREPDLRYIERTAQAIAQYLRRGQLVVLESTTYPGTTEDVLVPILETSGLKCGTDFFVGFSPEREDPGNIKFDTHSIPKIVSGRGTEAAALVETFYASVVERVVCVSTPATAEAVKITENVFRAVNVALVNELKVIFDKMDIDVWEVINAAATKPFGYMPFYPGPGLGGHCIPIDPFYLTWRAREFGVPTRFIELAGEINLAMPAYVMSKLDEALDRTAGKSLGSSRILVLGVAYKKNVADMRESPALRLIELCTARGAEVVFHDPHVPVIPLTREHPTLAGMQSSVLTEEVLAACDAVLIATDHDAADYALVAQHARIVVDTRNVMERQGFSGSSIIKA